MQIAIFNRHYYPCLVSAKFPLLSFAQTHLRCLAEIVFYEI